MASLILIRIDYVSVLSITVGLQLRISKEFRFSREFFNVL